jgi:hypothetical protein
MVEVIMVDCWYDLFLDGSINYEFIGTRDEFNELIDFIEKNKLRKDDIIEDIGYADMLINVNEDSNFKSLIPKHLADLLKEYNY